MDKPSETDFLAAARTMREYCFNKAHGCTGCPFQKLNECGVPSWDVTDAPDESANSFVGIDLCPDWWRQERNLKQEQESKDDNINHPSHYTKGGVECIDAIKAAVGGGFEGYLVGNIIKYLFRYQYKGGVEDLKKARWYLDRLIAEVEGSGDH